MCKSPSLCIITHSSIYPTVDEKRENKKHYISPCHGSIWLVNPSREWKENAKECLVIFQSKGFTLKYLYAICLHLGAYAQQYASFRMIRSLISFLSCLLLLQDETPNNWKIEEERKMDEYVKSLTFY